MATWPSAWWSLKIERVKYGLESWGTWAQEKLRWQGLTATANYRPILSSERAHHINKPETVYR
jgi:hypothetical protein